MNNATEKSWSEKLYDYLYTDWTSMTFQDWAGMIITLVIFILMAVAYVYTFRPKNRESLEERKYLIEADENIHTEKK